MKIGLSVAILWDYKELQLPNAISHSVDNLGYEVVEIHCEEPFFEGWGTKKGHETRKKIKDTLSVLDADVSLHAPYHDTNIATMNSGIGERSNECVRIKKPDGQWTTMGKSDIVIEGFIKSINEGRRDPKEWADAKAPRRWFVDAFLLECSKRRGNFGGEMEGEIQIGDLTFDRDEVEREYVRLKDGEMDFDGYVYRKYQTISENRGV